MSLDPSLKGANALIRHRNVLSRTERHSRETFRRIHGDTVSTPACEIARYLLEIEPATDRQKVTVKADHEAELAALKTAANT